MNKTRTVRLRDDMPATAAMQLIVADCVRQWLENVPVILADGNMENVHHSRVALRRLRSANKAFRKMRPSPPTKILLSDIQWLAGLLGNLRDAQIFAAKTLPPIARANTEAIDFSPLRAYLDKRAERSLDRLRKALHSKRYRTLIKKLQKWPASDIETTPGKLVKFSRHSLARRWRAVDELAAKWDDLDSTQRHSLRKHVKQLRYAIDFFAGLYAPKQIKKYLKYLEKLQTALGDLNDAVSARSLIRPLLRHSKYALTASAILGWSSCIEQNQLDAATAVLKQWQRHTPFWQ